MEDLSRLIGGGGGVYISGFTVGTSTATMLMILHLFCADDTLFCCGAELDQLWHLKDFVYVCVWFQAVSGWKINLGKSELVLVGNVQNAAKPGKYSRLKVLTLPLKYLVLPLGSTFKEKTVWNSIV